MTFDFLPLHFRFTARDAIQFSQGSTGNLLRGVLGASLHRVAPEAYTRLFEASGGPGGPSGLADRPRPFVLRIRPLDGILVRPGATFEVTVNLFAIRQQWSDWLAAALADAGQAGFGPGRGRAVLDGLDAPPSPVCLPLEPEIPAATYVALEFLTPTELKPVNRPEFAVLFARVRDRIATLSSCYGAGPLAIDFRGMGERAKAIRNLHIDVQMCDIERRSSGGQVHSIGGFTGTAEYEGDLSEFVPYLRAASIAGVGRHTVWGNGEVVITRCGR